MEYVKYCSAGTFLCNHFHGFGNDADSGIFAPPGRRPLITKLGI